MKWLATQLMTPQITTSRAWASLRQVCAERGVEIVKAPPEAESFLDVYKLAPNVLCWGIFWEHANYRQFGQNVLQCENGQLCQRHGSYFDADGFFHYSSLATAREYDTEPTSAERLTLETHMSRCFGWHPGIACDPNGPVLLALQSYGDSSVAYHCRLANWPNDTIAETIKLAAANMPLHRRVVVRPHPKDMNRWEEFGKGYRTLMPADWEVQMPADVPLYEFLPACSAVVTCNSTVGIEAAYLRGMRVAAFGLHTFTGSGTVLECHARPQELTGLFNWEPDRRLVVSYLCAVLRHQLAYDADAETVRRFAPFTRWCERLK